MVDRAPARLGDTSLVGGLLESFRGRLLRTLTSHLHPALHGRLDVGSGPGWIPRP